MTICFLLSDLGAFLFFLFLIWLLWLGLSMLCRIGTVKVNILVLFLIFAKSFSFCPLSMMLAVDLSYMAFMMLRNAPSSPTLLSVFIRNGCCTLSNAFYPSIAMIIWFLSFLLFMWCFTFIDLEILYHPCIPGVNPTWSRYMIFLMYCWMWFANILLRILASMFIRDIDL